MLFFTKKINKKNKLNLQSGMSYVELIVVLGIFSLLSGVVIYNYSLFQDRIEVKTLATNIGLKIVEAQKASLNGKLPPITFSYSNTWKPSYGVYFSTAANTNVDNKSFIYFTDLDNTNPAQNGLFDGTNCSGECLEKITITKNNYISNIAVRYKDDPIYHTVNDLTVSFKRPNAGATIKSTPLFTASVEYVIITLKSPRSDTAIATIRVYPSGRVQVN